MIRPKRARIIGRAARRATRNAPVRLVAITASQSSSVIRISRVSRVMPALATSTSTGPERRLDLGEGRLDLLGVGDVALDPEHPGRHVAAAVGRGDPVAGDAAAAGRCRGRCPCCRRSPARSGGSWRARRGGRWWSRPHASESARALAARRTLARWPTPCRTTSWPPATTGTGAPRPRVRGCRSRLGRRRHHRRARRVQRGDVAAHPSLHDHHGVPHGVLPRA